MELHTGYRAGGHIDLCTQDIIGLAGEHIDLHTGYRAGGHI